MCSLETKEPSWRRFYYGTRFKGEEDTRKSEHESISVLICAMANTDGGRFWVGIDPHDKRIVGLIRKDKSLPDPRKILHSWMKDLEGLCPGTVTIHFHEVQYFSTIAENPPPAPTVGVDPCDPAGLPTIPLLPYLIEITIKRCPRLVLYQGAGYTKRGKRLHRMTKEELRERLVDEESSS